MLVYNSRNSIGNYLAPFSIEVQLLHHLALRGSDLLAQALVVSGFRD